jgi:hypothetical protein
MQLTADSKLIMCIGLVSIQIPDAPKVGIVSHSSAQLQAPHPVCTDSIDSQTIFPCATRHLYNYIASAHFLGGVAFGNFPGPGKHMAKVKGGEMVETSRVDPLPN